MLFNDNFPSDLHTHNAFQIIKLLIKKGNLKVIHNKIHINISIVYQKKENWINYIMRCNSWTTKCDFTYQHYIHISNYINSILPTSQHCYIQEMTKMMYNFILYTSNFLHQTKWEADTA